jgi:hypothetical protein
VSASQPENRCRAEHVRVPSQKTSVPWCLCEKRRETRNPANRPLTKAQRHGAKFMIARKKRKKKEKGHAFS